MEENNEFMRKKNKIKSTRCFVVTKKEQKEVIDSLGREIRKALVIGTTIVGISLYSNPVLAKSADSDETSFLRTDSYICLKHRDNLEIPENYITCEKEKDSEYQFLVKSQAEKHLSLIKTLNLKYKDKVQGLQVARLMSAEEWYEKGMDLYNQGNYEEALLYIDRALEIAPNYADAWRARGNTLNRMGRYDEATVCFEQAEKYAGSQYSNEQPVMRDDARTFYDTAIELYFRANYEEALEGFDKILAIDPDFEPALIGKE